MGFLTLATTTISTTSTTSTTSTSASSTFATYTLHNHNRQASSDKGQAGRTSQLWMEFLSDCIFWDVMRESIYSHVHFIIGRLLNVSPIHLMKKILQLHPVNQTDSARQEKCKIHDME